MRDLLNIKCQLCELPFDSGARPNLKNVQLRRYVRRKQSNNRKLQATYMSSFVQDMQKHWELLHIMWNSRRKDFEPGSGPVSMQLKILRLRCCIMSKLRLHMQNLQHCSNRLHKLQWTKIQSNWQQRQLPMHAKILRLSKQLTLQSVRLQVQNMCNIKFKLFDMRQQSKLCSVVWMLGRLLWWRIVIRL